jgi:predicted acetyltransferase
MKRIVGENMDKIKLTIPSQEMKPAVMDFLREFLDNGEKEIPGSRDLPKHDSYISWLGSLNAMDPSSIPSITYFAFRQPENKLVGVVDIRHYLTEDAMHEGHISFSIRPLERKRGAGTELLRLALDRARELGVIEVVIACRKDNKQAKKVIRRSGLEKFEPDNPKAEFSYYRRDL